jgi:2-C-methyl-D-erythritol 4-phosphate cytidylyltransferase
MGKNLPKQYLPLGDKTLLEQTLQRLLQMPFIDRLLVVLHPQDSHWRNLPVSADKRISAVTGGAERSDSVLNALTSIAGDAAEDDWVLVHDAARPCITLASIQNLCEQTRDHPVGGILGVPVSDTLKSVTSDREITGTIDRTQLWQAQTPQIFRFGLLRRCMESALGDGKVITDEASALEHYGYRPMIVAGQNDNIKITRAEDLLLAQWILKQQEQ